MHIKNCIRKLKSISPSVGGKGNRSKSWDISRISICCILSKFVERRIYSESVIFSEIQFGKLKECGFEYGSGPLLTNSKNCGW